ncbi:Protein obstructor-E [Amphibalanus amphitrite]|uniref:Protein obstructor-E n=1 Tax=Amphibalanus amphitrite TaxID=1232801 RepID=A0A6A4V7X4_AMPAM|nr:Protein obstructor-E [Amphibalanus amphitrite]
MASCRLALIALCCAAVAVQTQAQFSNNRFSSRRTSSSSSPGARTSAETRSSFNSRRGSQRSSQFSSQSSRAGGFSPGRTVSSSSSTSSNTGGFGRSTFGSNRRVTTNSRASGGRSSLGQTGGSAPRSSSNSLLKQEPTVNFNCPEPDGFFANNEQCDKYFQCTDGVAKEHLCPDGLLFHPERTYPCVYPVEASCPRSGRLQDPQATDECPRQFTTFRSADGDNCASFTRCVNGRAYQSACSDGLAFDENTLGCQFADMVAGCDATESAKATADCPRQFGRYAVPDTGCQGYKVCVKGEAWDMTCPGDLLWNQDSHMCDYPDVVKDGCTEAYLGFQCPQREFTENQVGEFTKEQHPSDCTKFYVCINKEDGTVAPRLQGCPEASVFDPVKRLCTTEPEQVPGCENAIPEEVLAAFRQRDSDEKERRANRLAELRSKLQG